MLLLYLAYALIMGAWVYIHAFRYGHRRRWSLAVVAAPVITPCYFIENPEGRNRVRMGVWLLGVLVLMGGEYLLHSTPEKNRVPADSFRGRAESMGKGVQDLAYGLDRRVIELDKISRHIARKANIDDTIARLDAAEEELRRFKRELHKFKVFLGNNRKRLRKEEREALLALKRGYVGGVDVYHGELLVDYLAGYRRLLVYTRMHHERLNRRLQPEVQNYDALYLRYRRAAKQLNRGWTDYHNFLSKVFTRYPALEVFFPGGRKRATLPIWWKRGTLLTPRGR